MIDFLRNLSFLGRKQKIALQIVVDTGLLLICFLVAMVIRLEGLDFLSNLKIWLPWVSASCLGIGMFWLSGLYNALVRFVTAKILASIARGVATFSIVLFISNVWLTAGIPRSVPITSGLLLFLSVAGLRFVVRQIFRTPLQVSKRPVVIYGAGEAGLELLNSLYHGRDYAPIAFVDDDRRLHGLTISGLPVHPPVAIERLVDNSAAEVVLLAMPNLTYSRRKEILDWLEGMSVEVKTIPGLSDIIRGKAKITEIRNVSPEDLLGRDPVVPNEKLLKQNIEGKMVMVSGAGGSIGSELCRQIVAQNPKALILYEISEFALYSIEAELREMAQHSLSSAQIIPILGSVQNVERLDTAIKAFQVETIYHAAAYKHVPLVEENVIEGIRNNVFGTLTIANSARENKVSSFILISTDKAVRPTNVMGATKRIAELICQALARNKGSTTFSMVRFGNVLGSSGSVVPRFQSQIEAGGPVTVTHPEINRYFMTIPEAAQLVIQAGALAKGGDVFVLDMGEPVRIAELAETMVKLHGLAPYFVDHPDEVFPEKGDIPICFTGLRKGEKLYEELLLGNNPEPTEHPRVMAATEVAMASDELIPILDRLLAACNAFDLLKIRAILLDLPLEYKPLERGLSDLVWKASQAAQARDAKMEETTADR